MPNLGGVELWQRSNRTSELQNILEGSMPPVCAQVGADFDRHNLGCIKTMNRQFGARGNPRAVSDVKKTKRKGGSQTL
jgi:hypothetical protein